MKKFLKFFKDPAVELINLLKKKIMQLTNEKQNHIIKYVIFEKKVKKDDTNDTNIVKL